MRYRRERKAVFDNPRKPPTELTTLALKKKYADQTFSPFYAKSHERPIPNTSLQIPVTISPIQSVARPVSPTERRIIHEEVQKMLDEGIVQPSESPWSSPIVLIRKKTDDIIVFSETFEDHLIRLRLVLKCLQEAGLKLNSKKCLFAAQEVKILGHLVSSNGVRPDPDKIKAEGLPDGPLRLQEHDFDVKYKTGKKHSDADALREIQWKRKRETADKFLAVTTNGKLWLPVIPKHLRADILRHFHDAPTAGHLWFREKLMTGFARDFTGRECTEMSFAEVDEIAKFLLEEIVLRHGAPRVIITDRGAVFRSRLVSSRRLV
ncbi:retrovirus-related Pol polyprotein from transposon 297 [Trichonephila clavipes]|nr:retrovirus-related Pol polyprotein from transposon 297 [Trichonephila clavipes]